MTKPRPDYAWKRYDLTVVRDGYAGIRVHFVKKQDSAAASLPTHTSFQNNSE